MSGFAPAGRERINVFPVGEVYLFRHYFEDEVFDSLKPYYSSYDYRFEVPARRFDGVRALLSRHGYALIVVDSPEPFAVVKRKYTEHPDVLFSGSVLHRSLGKFNCFVMKDRESVERAVREGATPISETDLELDL